MSGGEASPLLQPGNMSSGAERRRTWLMFEMTWWPEEVPTLTYVPSAEGREQRAGHSVSGSLFGVYRHDLIHPPLRYVWSSFLGRLLSVKHVRSGTESETFRLCGLCCEFNFTHMIALWLLGITGRFSFRETSRALVTCSVLVVQIQQFTDHS